MSRLDQRTRFDEEVVDLDPATFLDTTALRLLDRNGELAGRGARAWGLPPLAVDVEGDAFTFLPQDGALRIAPGIASGATVAVMSRSAFSDWIQDQCSCMGMILGDLVEVRSGGMDDLIEWEPVVRALLDGRPVYELGCVRFEDRAGRPLDLTRSFRLGDDAPEEIAHFLDEAGFLHLEGVFSADEMDEVSRDIDAAIPSYTPDDGSSWWARTAAGDHRPVRLQAFQEHSPTTVSLLRQERFLGIGRLGGCGHEPREASGNQIEALVKPLDVVEGISDLPWHKDCALGRHSYQCCGMTVGISVTGADAGSGELGVLAGSHRTSIPPSGVHPRVDLPKVPLPTRKGDVTVHLSCTAHMSRPPMQRERRVMYTGFGLPRRPGETGVAPDKLSRIRERAPQAMGAESRGRLGRAGSFELPGSSTGSGDQA